MAAVTACGRVGFDATHDGGVDTGAVDGPTACVDPCALPLQPVVPLDSFDRPVGPLGAPWVTTSPDWLLTGSDLQVTGYSFAFYTAITGGAAQWAEVTLSQPTFNSELGVVLRGTGTNLASDRAIVVEYHEDPLSHFHISTVINNAEVAVVSFDADASPGDRMRVIARNGNIEIYLNGTQLMVTPPMDWPDGDSPGLIGLFAFYPVAARVDDFAGGSCGCP